MSETVWTDAQVKAANVAWDAYWNNGSRVEYNEDDAMRAALRAAKNAGSKDAITRSEHALQVTVLAEPIGGGKESIDVDVDIVEPSTPEWAAGLLRQIADDLEGGR